VNADREAAHRLRVERLLAGQCLVNDERRRTRDRCEGSIVFDPRICSGLIVERRADHPRPSFVPLSIPWDLDAFAMPKVEELHENTSPRPLSQRKMFPGLMSR